MGPQQQTSSKKKVPQKSSVKHSRKKPCLLKILVLAGATLLIAGGGVLVWYIVNQPTKQDYESLAAARKEVNDAYGDLYSKTTALTGEADFLSSKSHLTLDEYKAKSQKLSDTIESLGRNKAVQRDPVLREKYDILRRAKERYDTEFGKLFRDIERIQQATEKVKGLSYTGPEAIESSRKMRLALESITGIENHDVEVFLKDVIGIYKQLEPLYVRYYASGPDGDSSMTSEVLSTALSLLKPVGTLGEALSKMQKEVDMTDELNAFYTAVNTKLKSAGIATIPITKKYCLTYEKLCLQIPLDWKVDYTSSEDFWTETPADSATFKNAKNEIVMHIYQWGGSVGGHCQDPNPPTIQVKYLQPESTLFTDDSLMSYPNTPEGKTTISKLVVSADNGKTWQWALAGKNYLVNPKWTYGIPREESAKLKPVFDQELTLTHCASTFTQYNTAFRVPSKYVKSDDITATLVIESGRKAGEAGKGLSVYRTADEALADSDLEAATYAIKTAKYEE